MRSDQSGRTVLWVTYTLTAGFGLFLLLVVQDLAVLLASFVLTLAITLSSPVHRRWLAPRFGTNAPYVLHLLISWLTTALVFVLFPYIAHVAVLFFACVTSAALAPGRWTGLLTAVSSVLGLALVLLLQAGPAALLEPANLFIALFLLGVGALGGEVTQVERQRRALAQAARENARLLELAQRHQREADALYQIEAGILSERRLDQILDLVARLTADLVQGDIGAVGLFERDSRTVRLLAATGEAGASLVGQRLPMAGAGFELHDRLITINVEHPRETEMHPEAREMLRAQGVASVVGIPLVVRDRTIGALFAGSRAPRVFSPTELGVLRRLADQTAVAIHNSDVYDKQQRTLKALRALQGVTDAALAAGGPDDLLRRLTRQLIEALQADASAIYLLDPAVHELYLCATAGDNVELLRPRLPLGEGFIGRVAAQRQPGAVVSEATEPALQGAFARAAGVVSMMGIPLLAGDRLLGAIMVSTREARSFGSDDRALLQAVAERAATALEQARLQQEAAAAEALRQVDALKSELVAAVSHDLQTPLAAIRASVEGLLSEEVEWDRASERALLRNIQAESERLGRLVDDLLDMSRIEARALRLDRDFCDFRGLVQATRERLAPVLNGRPLKFDWPDDLPPLFVDPGRVEQVLTNLLDNAAKYAPAGAPIAITAERADAMLLVRVADEGPGIPAEHHTRVFERFFRLENSRRNCVKGTGLGLAICRGIVEAHGGQIWLEERPLGACFAFTLPLAVEPPAAEPAQSEITLARAGSEMVEAPVSSPSGRESPLSRGRVRGSGGEGHERLSARRTR